MGNRNNTALDYKVTLIADGIAGSLIYFTRDTLFYGFVDYLLIFLGEASIISIYDENKRSPAWCSAPPNSLSNKESLKRTKKYNGIKLYSGGPHEIIVYDWPEKDGDKYVLNAEKTEYLELILIELAKRDSATSTLKLISESAKTVIQSTKAFHNHKGAAKENISEKKFWRYFTPIKEAIDEIIETILFSNTISVEIDNTTSTDIKNLFCAVRYHDGNESRFDNKYDFTARMLLTNENRNSLLKGAEGQNRKKAMQFINDLQYPLGRNERSIADMVLQSSVVDFGKRPGGFLDKDINNNDEQGQSRRYAEKLLYPSAEEYSLCMYPVTVGICPWLVFYTFSKHTNNKNNLDHWLHHYRFYRDVLHTTAWRIREAASRVYPEVLTKAIKKAIGSHISLDKTLTVKINEKLRLIAQIYPLHLVQIVDDKNIGYLNFERDDIQVSDNPFFPNQNLEWDNSHDNSWLQTRIYNALRDMILYNNRIQLTSFADVSHALGTPLSNLQAQINLFTSEDFVNGKGRLVSQIKSLRTIQKITRQLSKDEESDSLRFTYTKQSTLEEFIEHINQCIKDSLLEVYVPPIDKHLSAVVTRVFGSPEDIKNQHISIECVETCLQSKVTYYDIFPEVIIHELVRNAIKHSHDEKKNVEINIELNEKSKAISISVSNYYDPSSTSDGHVISQLQDNNKFDIGLNSVKLYRDAFYGGRKDILKYKNQNLEQYDYSISKLVATCLIGELINVA